MVQRIQRLWDNRFATVSEQIATHPDVLDTFVPELEGFVEWVEVNSFDPRWRLTRFAETLELLPSSPESLDLAKTLDQLSSNHENLPYVMRCAELLTKKMGDRFRWSIDQADFKEMLKRGLRATDPPTRAMADSARDNLLRNCLFAYQDVR